MISRRRHVARCYLPPLLVVFTLAALLLAQVAFAALETEVVSARVMRVSAVGGGTRTVPDLAISGRVLAQLAPGVTIEQLEARLAANNCTLIKAIPHTPVVVIGLPDGMKVPEGQQLWAAEAIVERVEPDRLIYATAVPNDPLYPDQYHWPRIAAPTGWDVETGKPSTIVAVLDSGYDPDHPDLAGKWWVNQAELAGNPDEDDDGNGYVDDINGWDFVDGDNNPDAAEGAAAGNYDPFHVSHGTHVAGLIGALTNNGEGVAGHDWNCMIMPGRVLDMYGNGSFSGLIEGIQYAIDNGADVINMSLSGGYSTIVDTVIANAHAAGVVLVAAAGNESTVFTDDPATWSSPVCNDGPNPGVDNFVLGVAATDQNDLAAGFTNRDASGYNFVDVCAPGVQILSTLYQTDTLPDLTEFYGEMDGTSMASPIVAGLAALVVGHFGGYSADDVVNQIRNSCDDISAENPMIADTLGAGRINTAGALGLDVPPDPASNVQAFDTPNDEGGSITVTWSLPRQDGQDVQGYNLLRAPESTMVPGTPGSFTQIAQLPPGTSAYEDTPVPDHTKFWYQVVVFDASNFVPSVVAGPAEARDDLPPEPITNLVATDTQADDGGSISLSWFGYEYPSDLAGYHIYRATAAFTDTSGMEPIATRTPGQGQHYVDATTTDGTQYWYAVGPFDDEGNEETEVTAVGPVVSNPNFAFNYSPGLSLIAVGALPAEDADIAQILGVTAEDEGIDLAAWDPAANDGAGGYIIWSQTPGNAAFRQALGRAWWLRSDRPLLANISGQAAPEGDFEQQVVAGWNLWGNPFTTRLDFGATEVTGIRQGTPVSLATSNQLGYTRDYAWGYDPFTNSFKLITAANLPFATNYIEPGRGVFFLARRPATLLLKRSVAAAGASEPVSLDGWSLQLVAEAAGVADTDNFIGVSALADQITGVVSPPRPDADLDLYFVRPATNGARLATDFVTSASAAEWSIRVACAMPGATVRLSWPDLSQLPASCRPVLIDEDTGRTIYLRTCTGYTYEVGDEAAERNFTLRISDDSAALTISALSAGAADGRAQITYTLSADAAVDVEVLNIAGVTVRRLVADRAQSAGPQQLTWDGRNNAGAAVPAGTYLVRITARTDSGQQVSAVRSLQLGR